MLYKLACPKIIYTYICMYDLALNNPEELICH